MGGGVGHASRGGGSSATVGGGELDLDPRQQAEVARLWESVDALYNVLDEDDGEGGGGGALREDAGGENPLKPLCRLAEQTVLALHPYGAPVVLDSGWHSFKAGA
jgi:hypothetical protein